MRVLINLHRSRFEDATVANIVWYIIVAALTGRWMFKVLMEMVDELSHAIGKITTDRDIIPNRDVLYVLT